MKLVIGNKNYSTWSLRPWLLLRHFDVTFEEQQVLLFQPDTRAKLASLSPTGKVPCLITQGQSIWDSLAICEYLNEQVLEQQAWPAEPLPRAHARAIAAEMHSGFPELRNQWPMNIRLQRKMTIDAPLAKDIARIEAIWGECLQRYGGPWLFGDFSIADCMYAPIVMRFYSYQPALGPSAQSYMEQVLGHTALQQWIAAGLEETAIIKEDEVAFLLGEEEMG